LLDLTLRKLDALMQREAEPKIFFGGVGLGELRDLVLGRREAHFFEALQQPFVQPAQPQKARPQLLELEQHGALGGGRERAFGAHDHPRDVLTERQQPRGVLLVHAAHAVHDLVVEAGAPLGVGLLVHAPAERRQARPQGEPKGLRRDADHQRQRRGRGQRK
jgi:hypothetical protein